MSDWITNIMESMGYFGVALLMFAENIFPPIPSEVVMPAAGYAARQGEMSFPLVVLSGSIGSLLGVAPWYALGRWFGRERLRGWADRHGQWAAVDPGDIDKADRWFDRWGGAAVLFCRLVPGLRTLISVPAGLAEMSLGRFLLYSAIGTFAWTLLLAALGWWLQQQRQSVDRYAGYVGMAVIGAIVIWYVYRLARRRGWIGASAP